MEVLPTEAAEVACQQDVCEDAGLLQPSPARGRCGRAARAHTAVLYARAMLALGLTLWLWLTLAYLAKVRPPQQQALPELAGALLVSLEELHPQPHAQSQPQSLPVPLPRQMAITSSNEDNALRVWDLTSGQRLRTLSGHRDRVVAVAADFARQRAISACRDEVLKVWDLASGRCLRTLRGHTDGVEAVAVDFAQQRAVSASRDDTLKVWDLASGRWLRTLRGHNSYVVSVAADFAQQRAVSASRDNTLKVWDLASGQCLRILRGHTYGVFDVAADFARQRAVSASWDTTLKVWDLASGQCLRTLRGNTFAVVAVVADFTRQRALSASNGGEFKVWDLSSGSRMSRMRDLDSGCLGKFGWRCYTDVPFAVAADWAVPTAAEDESFKVQTAVEEEPFKFDCLTGAEMSWLPRQLVNLAPWEKREYSEELTSKATLAEGTWGSHSSHRSTRRLAGEATRAARAGGVQAAAKAAMGADSIAELFGGTGAAGACTLTGPEGAALAPLCAGLGREAGKYLVELFEGKGKKEQEEKTEGHEEGRSSVTGRSKRCTHSLQAKGEPVHFQAWQRCISLTYTHQISTGKNRSITIDLDVPGVDLVPTGHTPGKEYGVLPKSPESGCYSKSATDTISAIIKGSCV